AGFCVSACSTTTSTRLWPSCLTTTARGGYQSRAKGAELYPRTWVDLGSHASWRSAVSLLVGTQLALRTTPSSSSVAAGGTGNEHHARRPVCCPRSSHRRAGRARHKGGYMDAFWSCCSCASAGDCSAQSTGRRVPHRAMV